MRGGESIHCKQLINRNRKKSTFISRMMKHFRTSQLLLNYIFSSILLLIV